MNPIAITAGNQGWHRRAAYMVSERWNRLSERIADGFYCLNASNMLPWNEVSHPDFIKGFLWDIVSPPIDTIVWIDCDCFQVRPVGISDLPDEPFAAVKDNDRTTDWVRPRWILSREVMEFFNCGVFIADRRALPVFEEVKSHAQSGGELGINFAQEWFNLFVARRFANWDVGHCGWHKLGTEWNWMVERPAPARPIIVHLASVSWGRENIFEMFHKSASEIESSLSKGRPGRSVGPGAVGNGEGGPGHNICGGPAFAPAGPPAS